MSAKRILIVEDNEDNRRILVYRLRKIGNFELLEAGNGIEALEILKTSPPDLIFLDLKMPVMGGLELLKAISEHTPNVVTIIMTGFGTVETAIDAMKKGAYDYILKPFKVEEVVHTIRRGLEKRDDVIVLNSWVSQRQRMRSQAQGWKSPNRIRTELAC